MGGNHKDIIARMDDQVMDINRREITKDFPAGSSIG
jgi:hypothetical protein